MGMAKPAMIYAMSRVRQRARREIHSGRVIDWI
jgi:hypothetical protein